LLDKIKGKPHINIVLKIKGVKIIMTKIYDFEFQNLTKPQQECLGLIDSLGIYELRALARVFGDFAPTTVKRSEHIKIIMNKIISGEDLKPIPLRQGRPYKELSNIEGILAEISQITGKDYTINSSKTQATNRTSNIITFRQMEDNIVSQNLFPIETKGVLREKGDLDYYFTSQDNGRHILVKKEINNHLKPFDFVSGTAVIMNSEKEYMLTQLKTINFQNASTYKELDNKYEKEVAPSKKFEFKNESFLLGSRYIINTNKFTEDFKNIKELVTKLKESKIITIAIIPNVMYEDFLSIQNIGFNNLFLLRYDDKPNMIYESITTLINYIKRLQQQGHSMALFVEDPVTLANAIDFAFKNQPKAFMGHTEPAVEMLKSLVMLAKSALPEKNTTLFTTMDETDMFDQMYVSSIYKVSKKLNIK